MPAFNMATARAVVYRQCEKMAAIRNAHLGGWRFGEDMVAD
jgi:hypothetical protein